MHYSKFLIFALNYHEAWRDVKDTKYYNMYLDHRIRNLQLAICPGTVISLMHLRDRD